jgi:hypothetical protein
VLAPCACCEVERADAAKPPGEDARPCDAVDGDRISRVEVKPRLAGLDCTTENNDGEVGDPSPRTLRGARSGEPCSDPAGIAGQSYALVAAETAAAAATTASAAAILIEGALFAGASVRECSAAILLHAHQSRARKP